MKGGALEKAARFRVIFSRRCSCMPKAKLWNADLGPFPLTDFREARFSLSFQRLTRALSGAHTNRLTYEPDGERVSDLNLGSENFRGWGPERKRRPPVEGSRLSESDAVSVSAL